MNLCDAESQSLILKSIKSSSILYDVTWLCLND